ncbi:MULTISPECIES: signal peptidase I [unclassified Mesotoga]|uniref:signal peptidase I n=1 Tax=unclassified Mesotoga TaxID=1184398 RepID=UPI001BD62438|nr:MULTISPECIES: signal peptidase I [unclassified Mesotoga]
MSAKKSEKASDKKGSRFLHEVKEWGKAILYAIVFGTIIRLFVFETMLVPTGSMIPTINPPARLFVEKITYEYRQPDYGDIVVFWTPYVDIESQKYLRAFDKFMDFFAPAEYRGHVKYVKRLVGKPGDVLELKRAPDYTAANPVYQLYVNGDIPPSLEERRYVREGVFYDPMFFFGLAHPDDPSVRFSPYYRLYQAYKGLIEYAEFYDTVLEPLGLEKYIRQDPATGEVKVIVPEGFRFMMGDNSTNSFDSRYFGFVPEEAIIGSPMLTIWPLSDFGPLRK